jgi:hypothetical protein
VKRTVPRRARPDEPLAEFCEVGVILCCTMTPTVRHHKKGRVGPDVDNVEHTLDCCHACHVYVHANPAESYERGWMERRIA